MAKAESLWPANDALCAALQVINHLQDCAKDYRELNRVYIPEPLLAGAGIGVEALGAGQGQSGAGRRDCRPGAQKCRIAGDFAALCRAASGTARLALEVDLIQTLAEDFNTMLIDRDPLSQNVHHSKMDVAALFLKRFPAFALMRLRRQRYR